MTDTLTHLDTYDKLINMKCPRCKAEYIKNEQGKIAIHHGPTCNIPKSVEKVYRRIARRNA